MRNFDISISLSFTEVITDLSNFHLLLSVEVIYFNLQSKFPTSTGFK